MDVPWLHKCTKRLSPNTFMDSGSGQLQAAFPSLQIKNNPENWNWGPVNLGDLRYPRRIPTIKKRPKHFTVGTIT